MQKSDWLTQIRNFIAVVDNQSFTKAAEKRHTSPAALSRQVQWLEERLNVKLIHRTTRKLQITEEGRYLYEKGKQLFGNLNEVIDYFQKSKQRLQGPLKITMPFSFGDTTLLNLIEQFSKQHPEVEFTIDFANLKRDLIADEIDIAFRTVPYHGAGYEFCKIAELQPGVFASPDYLKKHGEPKALKDLLQHNCLVHYQMGLDTWEFKNNKHLLITGNIKANGTFPLINLARQGLGIVRTLKNYVDYDLASNKLVPVLEAYWPEPTDVYFIYRSGKALPLRIQTFIEFIKNMKTIEVGLLRKN